MLNIICASVSYLVALWCTGMLIYHSILGGLSWFYLIGMLINAAIGGFNIAIYLEKAVGVDKVDNNK